MCTNRNVQKFSKEFSTMFQHSPPITTRPTHQVVDAGAVPLLVLCVQEPELSLKRISASAISDIAKHTPELAQAVVDAGAVAYLAPLITNQARRWRKT